MASQHQPEEMEVNWRPIPLTLESEREDILSSKNGYEGENQGSEQLDELDEGIKILFCQV